jgi:hypothetical protein
MSKLKLYPWDECVDQVQFYLAMGALVHQQFNCAKCGTKQTMGTPNVFFELGTCEECKHVTDIRKDGCNYLLHLDFSKKKNKS